MEWVSNETGEMKVNNAFIKAWIILFEQHISVCAQFLQLVLFSLFPTAAWLYFILIMLITASFKSTLSIFLLDLFLIKVLKGQTFT